MTSLDISKLKKDTEAAAEVEQPKWQQYKSARKAMKVVTKKGIKIAFTRHEFITQNQDVIDFLDAEIAMKSLPGVTKGELLATDDRDPMATLRRTMKEELRAELAEEAKQAALGNVRDMGSVAGANNSGAMSTKGTAS